MLVAATVVTAYAVTTGPDTYSFFADSDVSKVGTDSDNRPVELGLRFTTQQAGTLSAVRFLKARGDRSAHTVSVWSATGAKLAGGVSSGESKSGWQQVALTQPVLLEAGAQYVVSYHTSSYRASDDYFAGRTAKAGPLTTTGVGTYKYGNGSFPTDSWHASNYWVDVVFAPQTGSKPQTPATTATTVAPATTAPAASPSASTAPAPSPSASSSTLAPAESVGLNLPRVPWEGGPSYYQNFAAAKASGFTDPNFFPVGVWFESVLSDADVAKDKGAGLNTYVELTDNSDAAVIRRNGMRALSSSQLPGYGNESVGWVIADEADMWGGAGAGKWTGKYPGQGDICVTKVPCGPDVMSQLSAGLPDDGRLRYANFGKGVMFWQTDQQAAAMVNQYTSIVSSDIYWYTDPYVCKAPAEGPGFGVPTASCRRAANYGLTMDRIRKLDAMDGKRQPVYGFVEVGHPFAEEDSLTITPDQVAGAAMNSLIHEARGLIYFNHDFGGPCLSQHVLREGCGAAVRPTVTKVNQQVAKLAPVLNTESYQWTFNQQLDTMLKAYDGSYYVFAMPGRNGGTGPQKLTLPPGVSGYSAEVMFENRTVPVTGGAISDTFAQEFSYHIYKITPQ